VPAKLSGGSISKQASNNLTSSTQDVPNQTDSFITPAFDGQGMMIEIPNLPLPTAV
jgi:hypothetical protein